MAWNEEALKWLKTIGAGITSTVDTTPYLTTGNTNTANTVSQLQTSNTNLTALNSNMAMAVWQQSALKNGLLFVASRYQGALAAAANLDTIVITGSKPVLLFARNVNTTGASVSSTIYTSPTYTGGTAGTVYSANKVTAVAPTLTFFTGATISALGTQAAPLSYLLSGSATLLSTLLSGSYGVNNALGTPVYLPPSTTYLFRITNSDTSAANIFSQIHFYEGAL